MKIFQHCALTEHARQVQARELTTPKGSGFWAARACLAISRRPWSTTARNSPATSSLLLESSTGSPAEDIPFQDTEVQSTPEGRMGQHHFMLA